MTFSKCNNQLKVLNFKLCFLCLKMTHVCLWATVQKLLDKPKFPIGRGFQLNKHLLKFKYYYNF